MGSEAGPGEFELIARYFAPLAGEGAFGLKDDAALLVASSGNPIVVTQDAIAAGVHFLPDDPPDLIARKALRVNISDLIAKGSHPFAYSLALGLPSNIAEDWIERFARGLAEDQAEYGVRLTGGDTYTSEQLTVSVAAFGEVKEGAYRSRLGAKAGDKIIVSGCFGDAAFGLLALLGKLNGLQDSDLQTLVHAYHLPKPPFGVQSAIARFANAAMDVSDGLIGDLEKLCAASNISARIDLDQVPLSHAVQSPIKSNPAHKYLPFTGGDDYQVLLSVPAIQIDKLLATARDANVLMTIVGEVFDSNELSVFTYENDERVHLTETSFAHF